MRWNRIFYCVRYSGWWKLFENSGIFFKQKKIGCISKNQCLSQCNGLQKWFFPRKNKLKWQVSVILHLSWWTNYCMLCDASSTYQVIFTDIMVCNPLCYEPLFQETIYLFKIFLSLFLLRPKMRQPCLMHWWNEEQNISSRCSQRTALIKSWKGKVLTWNSCSLFRKGSHRKGTSDS